jgi:hypothetical protein
MHRYIVTTSPRLHRSIPAVPPLWQTGRWLLILGWLGAAAGAACAPWVDRASAALVLTAPDLAEFVKFLPEVRGGALATERLLFLAPLFVVLGSAPLVVTSASLAYPGWMRVVALAIAAPLALFLLPPVWSPPVLLADEFRLQTAGCGMCLVLIIGSRWLSHLPTAVLRLSLPPLWLVAPLLAVWQLEQLQPAVSSAYGSSVAPAWGAWATLLGGGIMSIGLWLSSGNACNRQDR